jgi:hypothetical protein
VIRQLGDVDRANLRARKRIRWVADPRTVAKRLLSPASADELDRCLDALKSGDPETVIRFLETYFKREGHE